MAGSQSDYSTRRGEFREIHRRLKRLKDIMGWYGEACPWSTPCPIPW